MILIFLLFGLIAFFFLILYITTIVLQEHNIKPYSLFYFYFLLNIGKLRKIINENKTAKLLYYINIINLTLIGLCILVLITMVIIDS